MPPPKKRRLTLPITPRAIPQRAINPIRNLRRRQNNRHPRIHHSRRPSQGRSTNTPRRDLDRFRLPTDIHRDRIHPRLPKKVARPLTLDLRILHLGWVVFDDRGGVPTDPEDGGDGVGAGAFEGEGEEPGGRGGSGGCDAEEVRGERGAVGYVG